MKRLATVNNLHQEIADTSDIEVLAMYGQRTGLWEGNLHMERISREPVQKKIQLRFNQWLEKKLLEDEMFIGDWMWIKDRWKIHKSASNHLNLQRAEKVIEETKKIYQWDLNVEL